jgi:hypothetical protein
MASSRNNTTVQWSGSGSASISAGAQQTSDAFSFNAEDWEADVQLSADNNGTPASGDTVTWQVAYSQDGTTFDTVEHAAFLALLDTYPTNTPGEDPSVVSVPLRTAPKSLKLVAKNNSGGRAITVSAIITTHRPQ